MAKAKPKNKPQKLTLDIDENRDKTPENLNVDTKEPLSDNKPTEKAHVDKERKHAKKVKTNHTTDPGGTSSFKVGNGAEYKGTKGHIKSISGVDTETGDPIDAVFVPHDGEHEITLVKFTDLENVVRS